MYESRCGTCEDKNIANGEVKVKSRKGRRGTDFEEQNIYVGETSRSLYERTKEHIKDGRDKAEDSHIAKHWEKEHPGENMPHFRFKIIRSFRDSLSRQVAESIRIDLRGEQVLNSKTVYSRNRLPRLGIEKTEWEREAEEKFKRAAMARERNEEMEKQRMELGEGQAVDDEGMMTELWRRSQVGCSDREDIEESSRPPKRRRGITNTNWGLEETSEEQERVGE